MTTERNERTDDLLNDLHGEVKIAGVTLSPADILFELDPIAYRQVTLDNGYDDEEDDDE